MHNACTKSGLSTLSRNFELREVAMRTILDDYLAEIDSWKQPVSDQACNLSPAERAVLDREARAWLEAKLGRTLEGAPWASKYKMVPN
jgi:hypothetical protein